MSNCERAGIPRPLLAIDTNGRNIGRRVHPMLEIVDRRMNRSNREIDDTNLDELREPSLVNFSDEIFDTLFVRGSNLLFKNRDKFKGLSSKTRFELMENYVRGLCLGMGIINTLALEYSVRFSVLREAVGYNAIAGYMSEYTAEPLEKKQSNSDFKRRKKDILPEKLIEAFFKKTSDYISGSNDFWVDTILKYDLPDLTECFDQASASGRAALKGVIDIYSIIKKQQEIDEIKN